MRSKASWYLVFLCFIPCVSTNYSQQKWSVALDSPYALILNLGMQTWGESRMMQEEHLWANDFFTWHDLIVGRLVRMQHYVKNLRLLSSAQTVLASDIAYLIDILTCMEEEQFQLDENNDSCKENFILSLIQNIKKQLVELL